MKKETKKEEKKGKGQVSTRVLLAHKRRVGRFSPHSPLR